MNIGIGNACELNVKLEKVLTLTRCGKHSHYHSILTHILKAFMAVFNINELDNCDIVLTDNVTWQIFLG